MKYINLLLVLFCITNLSNLSATLSDKLLINSHNTSLTNKSFTSKKLPNKDFTTNSNINKNNSKSIINSYSFDFSINFTNINTNTNDNTIEINNINELLNKVDLQKNINNKINLFNFKLNDSISLNTLNLKFIKPEKILIEEITNLSNVEFNAKSIYSDYEIIKNNPKIIKIRKENLLEEYLLKLQEINNSKESLILSNFKSKLRGLELENIVFVPYEYLKQDEKYIYIKYYDNIDVNLLYSKELNNLLNLDKTKNKTKKSSTESIYFADVLNSNHLNYIREFENEIKTNLSTKNQNKLNSTLTINEKTNKLQSKIEWYDNSKDYYQIAINKDGVVKFFINELLIVAPELKSQNYQNLKLLKNGVSYPFYFKSNDFLISEDDEMIFYGTKATGDSTLNDFYTNEQKYYLYYDNNINVKLLNLKEFKETGVYSPTKDIFIANYRFEKDLVFGHGYDFANCDHNFGEFWYWDVLYTISKNKLNTNLDLYFDYESTNEFYFGAEYKNFTYNNRAFSLEKGNLKVFNNLDFNFNQNKISEKLFQGLVYDTLGNLIPKDYFRFGQNQTEFNAKYTFEPPKLENKLDSLDAIIGVDAYIFNGSIKPIAYNGFLNAEKTSLDFENNYYVEGFNNQEIIYIDTLNNEIAFPITDTGFTVIANTNISQNNINNSNNTILTQVEIKGLSNIEKYTSNKSGYHFITISNNQQNNLYYENSPLIDNIKNVINNDVAVIIINSKNKSEDLNTFLFNNGATKILNDTNSSYIAIFSKGVIIAENTTNSITNLHAFINENTNNYRAKLFSVANKNEIFIISDSSQFSKPIIEKVEKSNLKDNSNSVDLIVLTHKKFLNSANEYAKYRREQNKIKVLVINKEDIYKEFNYGKESPQAIKDFLKFAYDNWSGEKISFLTIIGDASWDPIKHNPKSKSENYVPTYGWPTTDTWYGLLDDEVENEKDYLIDIGIGRIPVNEEKELYDYLDKIKEYESLPTKRWMSNILNISGGFPNQIEDFYSFRNLWVSELGRNNLCFDSVSIKKKGDSPVGNNQGGEVRGAINNGAFWVSYLGHASANLYDVDGWEVNTLNNKGKYPILSSLSCNTGAFAEPEFKYSRSEEYVLTPNRGFIVALSSTFTGIVEAVTTMQFNMFASISRENLKYRNTSAILNYSKLNLGVPDINGRYNQTEIDILLQNCLIGDPLIDIKLGSGYDLFFEENDFTILNENGNSEFTEGDKSVFLKGKLNNNGYKVNNNFKVSLIHTHNGISETKVYDYSGICLSDLLEFEINVENKVGQHYFKIIANPDSIINETNYNNNTIEFSINILRKSLLPIEPQNNWNVSKNNPNFIFVNPFVGKYGYEMKIVKLIETNNEKEELEIYNSKNDDVEVKENKIIFNPKINLEENVQYIIYAKYIDSLKPESEVSWLKILFWADNEFNNEKLIYKNLSNYSLNQGKLFNSLITNKEISLNYIDYKYKIIGACGNQTDVQRRILVQYTDTLNKEIVFQDGVLELGFHVFKFSALEGKYEPIYRYYNTWESTTHPDTTSHVELVKFLRDSIGDDEYVFVTTMGETVRMLTEAPFNKFTNLDSLKSALQKFNTKAFEKHWWGNTYALGSKIEGDNFILLTDSSILHKPIEMSGTIKQARSKGSYSTDWLWGYNKINSITYKATENVKLSEIFVNNTFSNLNLDTINSNEIEISEKINDNNYKIKQEILDSLNKSNELKLDFVFKKEKSYIEEKLSDIEIDFTPSNELALIKSKISLDSNNYLRGYNAKVQLSIENLSKRFKSQDVYIKYSIINSKGNKSELIKLGDFEYEEVKDLTLDIPTDFLDTTNIITFDISNQDGDVYFNELYKFNNNFSLNLNLKEDNTKPTIKLTADSKSIKDKDFVALKPKFKVEVEDNSLLEFQSRHIQFLLNRYLINENNCIDYNYQNIEKSSENENPNLKATLEFTWENNLDFGENSISVRAFDRTGNKADTIEIRVFVSRDGFIKDLINYPNPTIDNTKIKFNLLLPENNAKGSLYLYDELGNFVNQQTFVANIGENILDLELKNSTGNSLSNGRYYYFIKMNTKFYIEDVSGIIVITK